ncbi:MAG: hypothetical protein WC992_08705 [Acholeplasmataceae bacterium]
MKRKRLYRWVNKGGLYDGPTGIVQPGDTFIAYDSQVPQCFRDTIEQLEEIVPDDVVATPELSIQIDEPVAKAEVEAPAPAEPLYEVSARGAGWYDVINTQTGDVVNEMALRLTAAEALVEELTNE